MLFRSYDARPRQESLQDRGSGGGRDAQDQVVSGPRDVEPPAAAPEAAQPGPVRGGRRNGLQEFHAVGLERRREVVGQPDALNPPIQ